MTDQRNTVWRVGQAVLTGIFATVSGLCVVLFIGLLAWPLVRGLPGILLGAAAGAATAAVVRSLSQWPASVLAGACGSLVASYFAIASAEVMDPGTLEWVIKGGVFGGAFGVPVGAVLGLLGLTRGKKRNYESRVSR